MTVGVKIKIEWVAWGRRERKREMVRGGERTCIGIASAILALIFIFGNWRVKRIREKDREGHNKGKRGRNRKRERGVS